jgi:hypothetical protein
MIAKIQVPRSKNFSFTSKLNSREAIQPPRRAPTMPVRRAPSHPPP